MSIGTSTLSTYTYSFIYNVERFIYCVGSDYEFFQSAPIFVLWYMDAFAFP